MLIASHMQQLLVIQKRIIIIIIAHIKTQHARARIKIVKKQT